VIGPDADDPRNQLGDYIPTTIPQHIVTILEGIKQMVSPGTKVTYYPGKKDHHKRVATERPHPRAGLPTLRAWARPREGHGKGKLIRILVSVYFGGFRG